MPAQWQPFSRATINWNRMILDFSYFPAANRVSGRFGPDGLSVLFTDRHGRRVDLTAVRSFWWRRPQSLVPDPNIVDQPAREFALQESLSALYGILRVCPGLWVNDTEHNQNADLKPRQLATMQRLGLSSPETLITNDPDEALAFFNRHDGQAFNQRGLIWLPTRRLTAADLAHLHQLPCSPVIFQRYIDGVRDIRVTIAGNAVLASEFSIEHAGHVDHRMIMHNASCALHRLPPTVGRDVLALVRGLHLEYGSVDLRLTHARDYVFFELNTAGEFLYLQDRTGSAH